MVTFGKPIGSGVPSGAYGMRAEHAQKAFDAGAGFDSDWSGVGGTLAANALSMAAMAATLENVLTPEAYEGMFARAERFEAAGADIIARHGLPWHMCRLGCRVEYRYAATPPVNGSEAFASTDEELDDYTHIYALNRGVLLTPFHNMALMSPVTTDDDVDRCAEVFEASIQELIAS
jgi:glutamate-1-semialdehyde 2,1-aminomutase